MYVVMVGEDNTILYAWCTDKKEEAVNSAVFAAQHLDEFNRGLSKENVEDAIEDIKKDHIAKVFDGRRFIQVKRLFRHLPNLSPDTKT